MNNFVWTLEHIGLPAADPQGLQDWYLQVLDGELVWSDPAVPAYFVRLAGGMIFEIYRSLKTVEDVRDNSVAGFRHLALQVKSIDVAKAELEGRGVSFPEDPKPAGGGGRVLFFADPEGNLLHLVERPEGSVFALVARDRSHWTAEIKHGEVCFHSSI